MLEWLTGELTSICCSLPLSCAHEPSLLACSPTFFSDHRRGTFKSCRRQVTIPDVITQLQAKLAEKNLMLNQLAELNAKAAAAELQHNVGHP